MWGDALVGGQLKGQRTQRVPGHFHPYGAAPWRGPRGAALGLQGLDQLLALRWKLLHQPSLRLGQRMLASQNLHLGLHT